MSLVMVSVIAGLLGRPRVSGDEPNALALQEMGFTSTPRERG